MANNWIYIHEENIRVRYVLGENGKNPLICIGINPSTAKPNDLDPTLTKVRNIAANSNYDGWIMLNIYPLRDTNSDDLPKEQFNRIFNKNIDEINKIISKYPNSDIWCAWGTIIEKRKYLKSSLKILSTEIFINKNKQLKCICLTKKGHPKHPLYCRKDSNLISFDITNYNYIK